MTSSYRNNKMRKRLLLILPLIALAVIGMIVYAYMTNRREFKSTEFQNPDIGTQADVAMGKVHQVSTRDGRTEWVLDAASAQMAESDRKLRLSDISMVFYPEGGGEVHLSARNGTIQTDTNDVEVSDDIVIMYDTYKLYSDHLVYEKETNRLASTSKVTIVADDSILTADGMQFDLNTRNATFIGNVTGTINENLAL